MRLYFKKAKTIYKARCLRVQSLIRSIYNNDNNNNAIKFNKLIFKILGFQIAIFNTGNMKHFFVFISSYLN